MPITRSTITRRDEMAMSGQRLLAASGQIPMAAHSVAEVPVEDALGRAGRRYRCRHAIGLPDMTWQCHVPGRSPAGAVPGGQTDEVDAAV
jgi:hypothetical protein